MKIIWKTVAKLFDVKMYIDELTIKDNSITIIKTNYLNIRDMMDEMIVLEGRVGVSALYNILHEKLDVLL